MFVLEVTLGNTGHEHSIILRDLHEECPELCDIKQSSEAGAFDKGLSEQIKLSILYTQAHPLLEHYPCSVCVVVYL